MTRRKLSRRRYRRAKNMHIRSGVFPTRGVYARATGKRLKRKPIRGGSDG